jgi:hypothetical protein
VGCLRQSFIPSSACYDNQDYAETYQSIAGMCRAGGTGTGAAMFKTIGGDLYFCSSGTATAGLDGWTCGCGSDNSCLLCSVSRCCTCDAVDISLRSVSRVFLTFFLLFLFLLLLLLFVPSGNRERVSSCKQQSHSGH